MPERYPLTNLKNTMVEAQNLPIKISSTVKRRAFSRASITRAVGVTRDEILTD